MGNVKNQWVWIQPKNRGLSYDSAVCINPKWQLANCFLPARCSKRCTCYSNVAGWLAGWVSVTRRYCIKTGKPILKLFQPSGSPIILVSSNPCADTKFQGEPSAGALNARGGKNWRFSIKIAIYLGNCARYADSYCGTLIGCRIEWYHFQ